MSGRMGTICGANEHEREETPREERESVAGLVWADLGEMGRGETSEAYPKRRSGWDMKSVMRSSMLRGSRTNVGNVTLCRSMPTLFGRGEVRGGEWTWVAARESRGVPELRDER